MQHDVCVMDYKSAHGLACIYFADALSRVAQIVRLDNPVRHAALVLECQHGASTFPLHACTNADTHFARLIGLVTFTAMCCSPHIGN